MVAIFRSIYTRIALGALLLTSPLLAEFTLNIGPPSLGIGGNNPVSIPPINPLDYAFVYVTENQTEWTLSISPGAFYGYRFYVNAEAGVYVSGGWGIVLDGNGVGPGVYTAVGWNQCGSSRVCFNAEYKQALGLSGVLLSPYAVRIGVTIRN